MAHAISGVIGRSDSLRELARSAGLTARDLEQGYAFVPLIAKDVIRLTGANAPTTVGPSVPNGGGNFRELTSELVEFLRRYSMGRELAYLETEYFGGSGGQGALVFRAGDMISGPTFGGVGVINGALALIGVTVNPPHAIDEFDAIGLTHIRSNDQVAPNRSQSSITPTKGSSR